VLQNRPGDCEILVAHDGGYEDPYALRGDVQFVDAGEQANPIELVTAGCRAAKGDVLHLLQSGAEVEEGWAEPALTHFDDPRVAAVAPLVLDATEHHQVISAGITYGPGGGRWIRSRGAGSDHGRRRTVLGPTLGAAFYRRSTLASVGGIDPEVGLAMADVEIALSLKARGYRAILEPESRVYSPALAQPGESAYVQGRGAERVFWRHASELGWLRSLALHPAFVAGEFVAGLGRGDAVNRLLGRVAVCLDSKPAATAEPAPTPAADEAPLRSGKSSIRIDTVARRQRPRPTRAATRRERAA
jgi:hypothetical protein